MAFCKLKICSNLLQCLAPPVQDTEGGNNLLITGLLPLLPTFLVYELHAGLHELGQGGVVAGHGELAQLTPTLRVSRATIFLLLLLRFLLFFLFSLLSKKSRTCFKYQ